MLEATLKRNDKRARSLIWIFSVTVFTAVALLGNVKPGNLHLGFDVHLFAAINAVINSVITVLLVTALAAVKRGRYLTHKRLMITALALSVIFLLSYITHHLLAGEAVFGDSDHNGTLSPAELAAVGKERVIYLVILFTHIILAATILPFILFTAYRGLTGQYDRHRKLARYTWPLWLYVSITGPLIYWMISPYYH